MFSYIYPEFLAHEKILVSSQFNTCFFLADVAEILSASDIMYKHVLE